MMSFYLFEILFILVCFSIDIYTFIKHKNLSLKKSILNFSFWTCVALLFFVVTYFKFDEVKAGEFLAGYVLERTLSFDNVFVFYIIFNFFNLSSPAKQRVLFWGIVIAMVLRVLFISAGAILVSKFYFLMYIFGLFLIFTGIKLIFSKDASESDFANNPIMKICRKIFPIIEDKKTDDFTKRVNGKLFFTPVFLAMILVGITDIIFALDSIPAIFGITLDPLIIIMANFLSLMGLRAIFSLISKIIEKFHHLKYALSAILLFIGIKMLIAKIYHISIFYSLLFIFGSIGIAIFYSIISNKKNARSL